MKNKEQHLLTIKLTNTLSRKKELFTPITQGEVTLYTCGPTVYNFVHIGNLRTFLFEDTLKRMFSYAGYKVKHVMNITDVGHLTSDADEGEDKMLKGAKREHTTVWEIAKRYTEAFLSDYHELNMLDPDTWSVATEHIKEMQDMILKLEKKGFTYQAEGNVYYDIEKYKDYGKLAKLKKENLKAGARVKVDDAKKNPHDFVLWFTKSKFGEQDMQWDSPWGRGYPGWHIECSAMATKYFGEYLDIHCGGIDHISVHHTNEIAQTEGAVGHKWVNYWMHCEFMLINDGKMAKSAGNFVTLGTLKEKGYAPADFRYFTLQAHYRTKLNFTYEALDGAKNARRALCKRWLEWKKEASIGEERNKNQGNKATAKKSTEEQHQQAQQEFSKRANDYKKQFAEAITNDLDTPNALAVLWAVVKDKDLTASEKMMLTQQFDQVFGLNIENTQEEEIEIPESIKKLIQKRETARKNKDFAEADKIREQIQQEGYSIDDGKDGVNVRKV